MIKDTFVFQDEPAEALPPEQLAQGLKRDLYEAMADDASSRRWKKQAITRILELDEALADAASDEPMNQGALKKAIRQAEDLLNQLHRY